jgi:hypothetical protein
MEYAVGALLAFAVIALAWAVGLDRGRAFYPTVLIVIATYYVLFAVVGASERTLLAVMGFRKSLWLVAVTLVGHGIFDLVHHLVIRNPGVPHWWPGFCLTFDAIAGGWLGVLLVMRSRKATTGEEPT